MTGYTAEYRYNDIETSEYMTVLSKLIECINDIRHDYHDYLTKRTGQSTTYPPVFPRQSSDKKSIEVKLKTLANVEPPNTWGRCSQL
jgi:hypothetical protein